LNLEKHEGRWEIGVDARKLHFKIELASHEKREADCNKNLRQSLQKGHTVLPLFDISRSTATPLPYSLVNARKEFYELQLGKGGFAEGSVS